MEMYLYGAGTQMQKALNAVATFFTTNTFGSLVETALQLGFVIATTLFFLYRDSKHVLRFAVVYLAIPTFLISMKTTVQVIDVQEPMASRSVANVPYIVAIPGWAATTLMHGLTQGIETVFSSTDDRLYSTSGMVFGSNLYTLMRSTNSETVALQKYWKDFYHNCVLGDIRINRKYTQDAFNNAPDILGFLARYNMSPLRGLYDPDGDYQTCEQALPALTAMFDEEAKRTVNKLASYVTGRESTMQTTFLRNAIENSHSDLIGISNSSLDILKQNMAINMTRWNLQRNAHSMATNYAYTTNQMQTTTMWANIGLQAKEFIPMMHSIGIILFACFGCIVVIIALLPHMTLPVLKNYFGSFFYLATWPMVFTILNAISLWFLENATQGATHGLAGITLSNVNGIDYVNTKWAAITGYLMMSTPAIAYALTKGAASMMNSLNYQLAGMINQTNARTSAAASTGDISHGNTQLQTHSFNNVHGNKYDTSTLLKQHGTTTQASDGLMTTQYGNRTVYDTSPTASNFQWDVATSQQYSEAVNDVYTQAQSNLSTQQAALSQNIQGGTQLMADWKDSVSRSQSYGLNHGRGATAAATQGLEQVKQATDQVAEEMGWSHDKANAYLHSMYGGFDGKVGGKLGGKAGPLDLSLGLSASAGTKWTDEDRETLSNSSSEKRSQIEAAIESFRSGVNQTTEASNRFTADESKSEAGTYARGFVANFNETQGLMTSATQSQQEVDTLSRANSQEQRLTASLSEKLVIPFQEFVETRYEDGRSKQILTGQDNKARQDRANEWEAFKQTEAFKDFVLANVPSQETHQSNFNGEPTQAQWQTMAGEHYKGKALSNTSEAILEQHEQRGGTDAYYQSDVREQIVEDARDSFNQRSDHLTSANPSQEPERTKKMDG